jgi:hypothetical protein
MEKHSFCDDGLILLASIEEGFYPFSGRDEASMLLYEERKKEARAAWIQHRHSCHRCSSTPARRGFFSTLSVLSEAERGRLGQINSSIKATEKI